MGSGAFCAVSSRTLEVGPPMEVLPHSLGTREQGETGFYVVRRRSTVYRDDDRETRKEMEGRSGRWAQCRVKIIKTNDLIPYGEVMSGRVASQTGYMLACPGDVLFAGMAGSPVHCDVLCGRAHPCTRRWAGPGWNWGPGGNSAGVRSGTTGQMGPSRCNAGSDTAINIPMSISNVNSLHTVDTV